MRYVITVVLCCLLALVHIQLWWGESSSYAHANALAQELETIQAQNEQLRFVNSALKAELKDLQESTEILEHHARSELGMLKPNEVLIVLR